MSGVVIRAPLTPKADTAPYVVKFKVFWKTTRYWKSADVVDFQKSVPQIAERLRTEQYWNKNGDIRTNKFTCEDFAIRVLCEYASAKGLPVKLTTGVRTYRNMELYDAEMHAEYPSNMYGFSEMVMKTYGAADMQRVGANTISIGTPEELLQGDILGKANDLQGRILATRRNSQVNVAHHIQMVVQNSVTSINIYQGNSDSSIRWPLTWLNKLALRNPANPSDSAYGGTKIERGLYTKNNNRWDYQNSDTGSKQDDLLREFLFYRWCFNEFNR